MSDSKAAESKLEIDAGDVVLAGDEELGGKRLILATGHSARDVFTLLQKKSIAIERKDFAMGVRLEHPQSVIDGIRYHSLVRDPLLPPASYSAVEQVRGLGVYAFCICPGGIIAPCATSAGSGGYFRAAKAPGTQGASYRRPWTARGHRKAHRVTIRRRG